MDTEKLYKKGFAIALSTKCSSKGLILHLEEIKKNMDSNFQPDESEQKHLLEKQQLTIDAASYEKSILEKRLQSFRNQVDRKEKKIEQIEFSNSYEEQTDERASKSQQYPSFAIGLVLFSFVTFFLIIFYASIGFTALYGVTYTDSSIFNPFVFSQALSISGGALAFIFLFPMVFIGVGFMLYVLLEQRGKRENKEHGKMIFFVVLLTFLLETILSYKITSEIYAQDYGKGMYDAAWQFHFVFSEPNFYLVLFLGFGVYLLWGFLLNYILGHAYRKYPFETFDRNAEIIQLSEQLIVLNQETQAIAAKIISLDLKIHKTEMECIALYENGVIDSQKQMHLKAMVKVFMKGYNAYAKNALIDKEGSFEALQNQKNTWLLAQENI